MRTIEVDKLYDINDIHTQYVYRIVDTIYTEQETKQIVIKEYITDLNGVVEDRKIEGEVK
jgi:hypothetical protein